MKKSLWAAIATLGLATLNPLAMAQDEMQADTADILEEGTEAEATAGEVDAAPQVIPYPDRLADEWYLAALVCTFCDTMVGQKVQIDREETVLKYYDRVLLQPSNGTGNLILLSEKERLDLTMIYDERSHRVLLVYYNEGDLPRVGESFATIWELYPTGGDQLLYGRAYQVSVFSDDGFDEDVTTGRWKARSSYFNLRRIQALLADVRVSTLDEDRRLYVPSNEVRISYDGAQALFRLGITEADLESAKADAVVQIKARAERVALYQTLVSTGDGLYAKGELDKALDQYLAASAIRPGEGLVYANMGAVHQMARRYPEAEQSYRLAADLTPNDPDILFNLGVVAEAQRQWSAAQEYYQRVIHLNPGDKEAQERLMVVEPMLR